MATKLGIKPPRGASRSVSESRGKGLKYKKTD
jgi:hypothetical protein